MPVLSDLRAVVRRAPMLSSTTVISNADVNLLLNEGALDLAKRAHPLILSATWSGVASTQSYVISGASPQVSNFLELYARAAGGLIYTQSSGVTKSSPNDFQWTSESELDKDIPGWQDATASDTLQKVYLTHDSSGYLNLGVYPKTSSTTPTFKLYFVSRGADMDGDTKAPWLNSTTIAAHHEPYHKLCAWYALWHLYDEVVDNQVKAEKWMKLYLSSAEEMREKMDALFHAETFGLREESEMTAVQSFGGQ